MSALELGPARESHLFLPCLGCLLHFPCLIEGRVSIWRWILAGAVFGRCSGSWGQAGEMPLPPRLDRGSAFVPGAGGLAISHCSLVALCLPSSAWLALAGRESEKLPPASKIPLCLALWNRKEGETPVKQRVRLSALVCVSVSPLNALRGQSWVAFA